MKSLLIIFIFIAKCYAGSTQLTVWEAPNVLEIMDQFSGWHSSTIAEYTTYLESLNIDAQAEEHLFNWEKVRQKYARQISGIGDLTLIGAGNKITDEISFAFYSSKTTAEALKKLQKKIKKPDLNSLTKSIKAFTPKINKILKTMATINSRIPEFEKGLKKNQRYFSDLSTFFDTKKDKPQLHFIWAPISGEPIADYSGKFVLFRINPEKHDQKISIENLVLGLTYGYLSFFGAEQLKQVEVNFREGCKIENSVKLENGRHYFETPLIIALSEHYYRFLQSKKNFNIFEQKNPSPWVNLFSRDLFQLFLIFHEKKKTFLSGFAPQAGSICQEYLKLMAK